MSKSTMIRARRGKEYNMNREDVIQNLLRTYQTYGVTRAWIEQEINSGLSHAFSYQTIYTGLRMALGNVFHDLQWKKWQKP